MFKKLKRQFIIIYSISIFLLVLFSFSLIFYSTYANVKQDIKMRVDVDGRKNRDDDDGPAIDGNIPNDDFNNEGLNFVGRDIYLLVNEEDKIITYFSSDKITDEDIESIQAQIKDNKSIIKFDSKYYVNSKTRQSVIKLVNITNSVILLRNLLVTLILIGIIITVISVAIGNFFVTKALDPVRESYEKQKSFVSDASHEIKTPISVISSCLDLIKAGDDESDKWIDYCIDETDRLKRLTATLLTLSKSSSDFDISEIDKIDLSEEVELLLSVYEVNLFEEGYDITSSVDEGIEALFLKDDFKQLFHILIDNAIKYNNKDKKIRINLTKTEKQAILEVSNSSEKIENSEINKIFDRFYRQDKVRSKKIEGFGLGLSLVDQILKKYNIKHKVKYEDGMFKFEIKFNLQ